MIKFSLYLLLVAATCCAASLPCQAEHQFLDEVSELVDIDGNSVAASDVPAIESTDIGYDLHKDMFYFSDDPVEKAYKRSGYANTKITLAGQNVSMTGNRVPKAAHPFAVGQKSEGVSGSSADRWDVKQDANGNQYLALYHAYNSHFVVNKLRAHLLRRLANVVKNYLPVLDKTHQLMVENVKEEFTSRVWEELIALIKASFQSVDDEIRKQMKDSDDSGASATVVILTQNFVIVANVGEGRVIAYDGLSETTNMSPRYLNVGSKTDNIFGSKKSRPDGSCKPFIEIYQRFQKDEEDEDYEIQLLLLETPVVANALEEQSSVNKLGAMNYEDMKIVLGEVKLHKHNPEAEQDLYTNSVTRILQTVTKKGGLFNKLTNTDYSVMLVGLQTDYSKIFS